MKIASFLLFTILYSSLAFAQEFATTGSNSFTGEQHIANQKSLTFGDSSNASRRLRISYYGDSISGHGYNGDSYIEYANNLYIKNPKVKDYIVFQSNGNVSIGQSYAREKLEVNGKIRAQEVRVEASGWNGWPDFVFSENYILPSLREVKKYVNEHKHLPLLPTKKEVEKDGVDLGQLGSLLLQKIEELTLYVITQQETIEKLQSELQGLKEARE